VLGIVRRDHRPPSSNSFINSHYCTRKQSGTRIVFDYLNGAFSTARLDSNRGSPLLVRRHHILLGRSPFAAPLTRPLISCDSVITFFFFLFHFSPRLVPFPRNTSTSTRDRIVWLNSVAMHLITLIDFLPVFFLLVRLDALLVTMLVGRRSLPSLLPQAKVKNNEKIEFAFFAKNEKVQFAFDLSLAFRKNLKFKVFSLFDSKV
jgi:hypothetical protein